VCGKHVSGEWLRFRATAQRVCDELVVEGEKAGVELAARARERVQVVKIKVRSDGDGDTGGGQYGRQTGCTGGSCGQGLRVAAQCR
jgi:hypothetical protein